MAAQLAEVLPLFSHSTTSSEGGSDSSRRSGGLRVDELCGRLVEFSGAAGGRGVLTAAMQLVLWAQQQGEPVAWITDQDSSFFPPDAAEGGVDLDALIVIRVPQAHDIPRAADSLARSGAFGLLVLDLEGGGEVPTPLLTRLQGLARKHEMIVAFLTEKNASAPSVGPLVSLRAEISCVRESPQTDRFQLSSSVLRDKRRSPGWRWVETCRAPMGA